MGIDVLCLVAASVRRWSTIKRRRDGGVVAIGNTRALFATNMIA
jgi:hypothetical protein